MNIVVCVNQVPDTWAERKLKRGDATLDRASVDGLINELDEYAIEEGLPEPCPQARIQRAIPDEGRDCVKSGTCDVPRAQHLAIDPSASNDPE